MGSKPSGGTPTTVCGPRPSSGRQHRFGLGDASVLLLLTLEIQVKAQLFLEVAFRRAAAQVRHEAIQQGRPLHGLHPLRRLFEAPGLFTV